VFVVPPYWQFDVANPQPRFAGEVSPEVANLLEDVDSQEALERLIEDAGRSRPSGGS
jgi:hypothetical protein